MRGRGKAWICGSAVAVVALFAGMPAHADETEAFYEIETKYIFGFTTGSGIGLEGEKEFSPETIINFGKRDGRYAVSATKFEYEFTPNQYIQIELGPISTYYDIRNVTGLDDMNAVKFNGFFGELRYLLLDRATNQAYYVALVEADAASLATAGDVKLQAGMPAEVYIKGEERTPLMYLVEPVTQVLRRAGRER